MIRMFAVVLCALALLPGLAVAQSADDAAAFRARQLFVDGNYAAALAILQPLAAKGHPRAETVLGVMTERGLGLPADIKRAVDLYRAAAEQGFAPAMHNLGSAYENGDGGLAKDEAAAREWYWKAAGQDYGPSLNNLGLFLRDGKGGAKDPETALALFERAAALGNADGTAQLAYMLATGDGAVIDLPRARDLYAVAAAQKVDWAERDYGEMLELAEGGPKDLPQAIVYYTRAAKQANAMAGMDIAEMVWANPDAFPDKVAGLAWCFWAEAQPPMWDGTEYDGRCTPELGRYSEAEVAAAREQAKGF